MTAAAELAELRERVDLLDAIVRALGVPLDQLAPRVNEHDETLAALSAGLAQAFSYAGMSVPEGLRPRPRRESHLRVVRGGAS